MKNAMRLESAIPIDVSMPLRLGFAGPCDHAACPPHHRHPDFGAGCLRAETDRRRARALLFSLGIIGTGLLALAASAPMRWPAPSGGKTASRSNRNWINRSTGLSCSRRSWASRSISRRSTRASWHHDRHRCNAIDDGAPGQLPDHVIASLVSRCHAGCPPFGFTCSALM